MKKHFLVTISSHTENLYGIKFLCSFFKSDSQHSLTLLHIYRHNSNDMCASLMEMWQKPEEAIEGRLTVGAKLAIDKSMQLIQSSQMTVDHKLTKTVAEQYGKVKDILNEGQKGLYDAIVLGKRAAYTLQWIFERPSDEIAQSIIRDTTFTTPIWICPEIHESRKNVLVCVDGSENAYRTVDHVGFIMAKQDHHDITLFHVKNSTGISGNEIFPKAEKILSSHGIKDERIQTVSTWGLSTAGTIQGILNRHDYAVVAVGLKGYKQEQQNEGPFAGATVSTLIRKVEGAAIWCCP